MRTAKVAASKSVSRTLDYQRGYDAAIGDAAGLVEAIAQPEVAVVHVKLALTMALLALLTKNDAPHTETP